MARSFTAASSELIKLGLGNLGFAFGPGSVAAILRVRDVASVRYYLSVGTSDTTAYRFWIGTAGTPGIGVSTNSGQNANAGSVLTTNTWYCIAVTKATGTVAPRMHIYDYAGNTWTHVNSGTSIPNSPTPATEAKLGADQNSAQFLEGDLAAVAVWDVVLSDSQAESLPFDLIAWYAPAQPRGLWLLDQAAISQPVNDISGGGANATSKVGTTVSAQSVPLWSPAGDMIYT